MRFKLSSLLLFYGLPLLLLGCQGASLSNREAGALGGAAVGAGLGAVVGSQVGHTAEGVAIGAAAGALSGGLVGDAQDSGRTKIEAQEEILRRQEQELERQKREIEDLKRQQYHNEQLKSYDKGGGAGSQQDSFSY